MRSSIGKVSIFPAGNRDIDRLEVNNDGAVSINVFETDAINENKIIKTRATNVLNC